MIKKILFIVIIVFLLSYELIFANPYKISEISIAKRISSYSTTQTVDLMDVVAFGQYNQDSLYEKEPIEWIVLDKQDNKYLLLSKYILTCRDYHDIEENVTWETCALRKWLNNTFLNTAFNQSEQSKIMTTNIMNNDGIGQDTVGGNDTKDKVFLLSKEEVRKYFGKGTEDKKGYIIGKNIVTRGTYYAKTVNNGAGKLWVANVSGESKYSWSTGNSLFWLRSPGSNQSFAMVISDDRELITTGYTVIIGSFLNSSGYFESGGIGVRPAIWVSN